MQGKWGVRVERLDHLGIVAGICREIGIAEYLDPTFRTSHSALLRSSFSPTNPGHSWPAGASLASDSTKRDCYIVEVFSAACHRIVAVVPYRPRTRLANHRDL